MHMSHSLAKHPLLWTEALVEAQLVDGMRHIYCSFLQRRLVMLSDFILIQLQASTHHLVFSFHNTQPGVLLRRLQLQSDAS